jgi:hypothetical protein
VSHIRGPDGKMAGSRKQLLSLRQLIAVREAWAKGLRRDEVARAAGITVARLVSRMADQLASLPRRGRGKGGGRRPAKQDPTPEEIYGRLTLEIQAGWTDEQREAAWRGVDFNRSAVDS